MSVKSIKLIPRAEHIRNITDEFIEKYKDGLLVRDIPTAVADINDLMSFRSNILSNYNPIKGFKNLLGLDYILDKPRLTISSNAVVDMDQAMATIQSYKLLSKKKISIDSILSRKDTHAYYDGPGLIERLRSDIEAYVYMAGVIDDFYNNTSKYLMEFLRVTPTSEKGRLVFATSDHGVYVLTDKDKKLTGVKVLLESSTNKNSILERIRYIDIESAKRPEVESYLIKHYVEDYV